MYHLRLVQLPQLGQVLSIKESRQKVGSETDQLYIVPYRGADGRVQKKNGFLQFCLDSPSLNVACDLVKLFETSLKLARIYIT
ncbi:hypothetical protein RRG08_011618 [Elysia crispata]|uniref:Uncharacterized protein n=1 Tax=Elysia crispata TaxID=231223 RepID=A0AAE0XPH0_9GAST|nr:hypothetical protein RRG08_011618 [Elysia crispata]